jgi:hypothetical protein
VARGLDKLHFEALTAVDLNDRAQITGAKAMLGQIPGENDGIKNWYVIVTSAAP